MEENMVLTPLPIDEAVSSLSAILLNDEYYELLRHGQVILDGIPVLKATCLIPFKAKAWLDLSDRKATGEHVDTKNVKKHKNDVFRLTDLITADTRQELTDEIAADMKNFLREMEKESVDLKTLGLKGADQKTRMNLLYQCYGISKEKDYIWYKESSFG